MRRSVAQYLEDILLCIGEIETVVEGVTLEEYRAVFTIHRTVERDFTIIAEALNHIGQISPELAQRVDHVRSIASFRNVIIHDYFHVDSSNVWDVIRDKLPLLKNQVETWALEHQHRDT